MVFLCHQTKLLGVVLYALSVPSLVSASTLDGICNGIRNLGTCKQNINIPISLATKMCDKDFFKVDSCKTKQKFRYPCGVSWKGVKWCDGWTCIPGTVKTKVSVACGVKVISKPLNICKVAKESHLITDEMIRIASGSCSCLPKVLDFVNLDTVKSVVSSLDISKASAEILEKYGQAQQCLIANGFNVQDNKAGLTTGTGGLVKTANSVIFTAAEIDLSRYIALAAAIAPCAVGECSPDLIRGVFMDYLTDSEKVMGEQIKEFLAPWGNTFDGIQGSFDQIGNDIERIKGNFSTVTKSIDKITGDFCRNITHCAETTVYKLKAKVEDTIKSSEAVIGLQHEITTAVKDSQELSKLVSEAIDAFDTLSNLGIAGIVDKVREIKSIEEVTNILPVAKRLPIIINELQKRLPNIQRNVKKLQDSGPNLARNINDILAESWLSDVKGDTVAAKAAEVAIQQIQAMFKDGILGNVFSLTARVSFLVTSLHSVFISGPPTIEGPHVASYQRWSDVSFDIPYQTIGKKILTVGAFSLEVDYPKFSRHKEAYTIPFPNHHIPYIKVTFPSKAAFGKRGDNGTNMINTNIPLVSPTFSTADLPYVTEAAALEIPTASLATPTTVITLDAPTATFTTPTDLYTDENDVPIPTAYNPSVVFFTTTDVNGAMVTASTTMSEGMSFEVTATEVRETATVIDVTERATASAFRA